RRFAFTPFARRGAYDYREEIAVRKRTFLLGLLSFFFLFSSPKAWSQSALTNVKITSPSRSIAFSDIYVVVERGFFREEKLEVELVQARPDLAIAGLIASEVDADN